MESPRVRQGVLITMLAVTASILAVLGYLWFRPPTRIEVGTAALDAAVNKDGARLLSHVGRHEREALHLSARNLSALLDWLISRRLRGFETAGVPVARDQSSYTNMVQGFQHPDGRSATLSFRIEDTDDGPKAFSVVLGILHAGIWAGWPPSKPLPGGSEYARFTADAIEQALPELMDTGVSGVALVDKDTGSVKVYAWSEYLDRYRQFAAQAPSPR